MLTDVARGLFFLHSHAPPIIHRDLTARNILLNAALTAKIADLGVARIVNVRPGQLAATMTQAPGNMIYMPPEAVGEDTRYNTAIDIFSFGNVGLFTLTQIFMKDLKGPNYQDPITRRIVARTEIERRIEYLEPLYRQFGEAHPLVQLVVSCLEYSPDDRPNVSEVLERLEVVQNTVPQNWNATKLEMVRRIEGRMEEQRRVDGQPSEKQNQISGQQELIDLQQRQLETQATEIQRLSTENQELGLRLREESQFREQPVQRSQEMKQREETPVAKPRRQVQVCGLLRNDRRGVN